VPLIRFIDGFEFDPATGELRRENSVARLEPQPAAVLARLVLQAGELVTHDELRRAVWGETTHVKLHDALHYCVRQIRSALGDTAREPRYIETIPRRGYRLRPGCVMPALAPVLPWRWPLRIAVAAAVLVSLAILEQRPNNHHQLAVSALRSIHDFVF
jgi:hypothetical protein